MSDDNMATMPIPDLVAGIREKAHDMPPLWALTLGVISGRLLKEYERANSAEKKLIPPVGTPVDQKLYNETCRKVMELQEMIDDCPYQRCPCRN